MKTTLLAAAAASTALLSSCLQNETTVHLNKDGSGTVVEQTTLGAQATAMMEQMAAMGGEQGKDPLKEMFSEENAKKNASKFGEGVTFEKSEPVTVGGNKGAKITYRFADINKLKLQPGESLNDMNPEAAAHDTAKVKSEPVTFTYGGGKLVIHFPEPKKPEGADKKPEGADAADMDNPQMQAMMKQMMGDMKMSVKLVVEPGISETDASYQDGNKLTLMEMEMGKVLEKPEAFKKLQASEGQDPTAAMETLKGIDGVKVETKREVTVKVK